ncbi:MAG: RNA polymerase sigma factor [Calditrichaeota bacterium]|nr:RNA polymerase sigma factor [Calditrichota bacterium]RQW02490.1 MAG: RNA polymerase sigma factor [Calditrichota bacterium]
MTEHLNDLEIIRKVLQGNLDAYKMIVDRYSDFILNLCYRHLYSQPEAEDATQDVFIKAYNNLSQWEPRAQFKTWLYRIAINHCLNMVRRKKLIHFQSMNSPDFIEDISMAAREKSAESGIIDHQKEKFLQKILYELPEKQRTVLLLYFYQELSYREIAETLKISLSSVESRLFRAKKALAKILKKQNISAASF